MKGFSHHDSPQGHLQDTSLPPVFAKQLEEAVAGRHPITRVDAHINDPAFTGALIACVRELTAGGPSRG